MKYIVLIFTLFAISLQLNAQYAFFPTSGTITYESKFHVQNYLKRNFVNKPDLDMWDKLSVDHIVNSVLVEILTKQTLKFYGEETLFETVKEDYPANYQVAMRYWPTFKDAKTYTNFSKATFSRLLSFGDDELILEDSIPMVKWKYTDEYRNIAGYNCRRANGIIQDSIYVVAFFTNQIPIAAGPELIQGLPGMILGVSIPSININMFATTVQLNNDPVSSVLTKKKKVIAESKESMIKKLKSTIYDWMKDDEFQKQLSKIYF